MPVVTLGIISLLGFAGYRRGFTASLINIGSYVFGGVTAALLKEKVSSYIIDIVQPNINDLFSQIKQSDETISVFAEIDGQLDNINSIIYSVIGSIIAVLIFVIAAFLCKTLLMATSATKIVNSIPIAGNINKILGAVCYVIIPIILIYIVLTNTSFSFNSIFDSINNFIQS